MVSIEGGLPGVPRHLVRLLFTQEGPEGIVGLVVGYYQGGGGGDGSAG